MTDAPHRRPVPDDLFGGRLRGSYLLDLEVAAVVDRSVPLRTITFRSPDLVDFEWEAGQDVMFDVPGAARPVRRRYTIRRADPAAGTLDVDVVLHGTGPFARWAADAAPGDRIDGIGPRGKVTLRDDAGHHLFVGDETAIPVTLAMVEALPAGARATALLGIEGGPGDLATPEASAAADIRWTTTGGLSEAVDTVTLPPGTVAYVNGERLLVREVSERLLARGLAREALLAKAYWRRDQSNADHGEPGGD
jgi:NADPH-dependent ferric siderophore reductase